MEIVAQLAVCPPAPLQAQGARVMAQPTAEPVENTPIAAVQAAPFTSGAPEAREHGGAGAFVGRRGQLLLHQNSTP